MSEPAAGPRLRNGPDRRAILRRLADQERAMQVLDAAREAFISIDSGGRVLAWNRAAEETFGWTRDEAIGSELAAMIIPERFRQAHDDGLRRFLATGEGRVVGRRVELVGLDRDGREMPIELTISATREGDRGDWSFHAFVRDVSDRVQQEVDLRSLLGVTSTLAESTTLGQALPLLLEQLCTGAGRDFAAVWLVDDDGSAIRACEIWHLPGSTLARFADVTRALVLAPGEGLPGTVWQTAESRWVEDLAAESNFPRRPAAAAAGLNGAVAVPIRGGNRVLGVLELFSSEAGVSETGLVEVLGSAGDQIGVFIDRVRAGEALERERDQQAAVLESMDEGVVACDADGAITIFNRAARALHAGREIGGHPDEWTERYDLYRADGKEPLPLDETPLYRALAGEVVRDAEIVIAPAGREPSTVVCNGRRLAGPDGETLGAVVAMQNVTEAGRAAEALRRSNDQLAQVQQIAHLGSFEWSEACGLKWSDEMFRILGLDPASEPSREAWLDLVHPDDRAGVERNLTRARDRGFSYQEGYRIVRPDGEVRFIEARVEAETDESGAVRVTGAVLDASDRRRADDAERANQAKSEFLSRMSHELRTPLNAILGFGQLLEANGLDERQRGDVGQIVKAGRHLLGLINEVLEIARIEEGRMEVVMESVGALDAIAEVLALTAPLAEQAGIQMTGPGAEAPDAVVQADSQRLRQILINLMTNAVKYNREGGSVTVWLERVEGERLRIAVTDTGPGIGPEDLERIFSPFERLGAEDQEVEGTGLGLALSQSLVEMMGGTLCVESQPGTGSTFFVELPLAGEGARRRPKSEPRNEVPAELREGAQRTLLYIEDNPSNMMLVEQTLARRPDLELVSAVNGELGLDLARRHRPDLVLLDLQLPDISGDEVLARLRADADTAALPVVVLSADATQPQIERLLAAGARAYLTKPLDLRRLLAVIDEVLAEAELERG